MWRTARRRVLIALLAALPATSAQAHHSYADFLTCESASISGKIAELQWVNPHVLVTVEDEQDVEHVLVWFSLIQAARAGVLDARSQSAIRSLRPVRRTAIRRSTS